VTAHRAATAIAGLATVVVIGLAGCGASPPPAPTTGPAATGAAAGAAAGGAAAGGAGAFNDTDAMFLQMSLDYIQQGRQVTALAKTRATRPEIRRLAADLEAEWDAESPVLTRWLTGWGRPLVADPSAGAHAGHAALQALRPSDIAELRDASGADFDRTALSLLIGRHHNSVEVTRLESAAGAYPPAKEMAATMTRTSQAQVQQMLGLLA
jgi:uncharacterized protein (DUF305 family)